MVARKLSLVDQYIITLKVIQPARIQDIESYIEEIWEKPLSKVAKSTIRAVHQKMREKELLVTVRKGTYVLTQDGMDIASRLMKERNIDNARIFLMKRQRRAYHG